MVFVFVGTVTGMDNQTALAVQSLIASQTVENIGMCKYSLFYVRTCKIIVNLKYH